MASALALLATLVFATPAADDRGAMLLGNGEIGETAWIDAQGTLECVPQRGDCWDETLCHPKMGTVRIRTGLPVDAGSFEQALDEETAVLRARWRSRGVGVSLVHRVDRFVPALVTELETSAPCRPTCETEAWHVYEGGLTNIPASLLPSWFGDARDAEGRPVSFARSSDVVLSNGWYHANRKETLDDVFSRIDAWQGVKGLARPDLLRGRVYGCLSAQRPAAGPARKFRFVTAVVTLARGDAAGWRRLAEKAVCDALVADRARHERAWRAFSERTRLVVTPSRSARAAPRGAVVCRETAAVSRAYRLQRYLFACAGRSSFPILFNGSLFTTARPGGAFGAREYRRWGDGNLWQNGRLAYYPLLMSGDVELTDALVAAYADPALLAFWGQRARRWFGPLQKGAMFAECTHPWGDTFPRIYGTALPFERRASVLQDHVSHKYSWTGMLEFSNFLLDRWEWTDDEAFLTETALPAIGAFLSFFDSRYEVGRDGKYVMSPMQVIETWVDARDPVTEVAGLRQVSARLNRLDRRFGTPEERALWRRVAERTPDISLARGRDGRVVIAPARDWGIRLNHETPELYPSFPYRLVSFEKPNAAIGRATYFNRTGGDRVGWCPTGCFAAALGLAGEARRDVAHRALVNSAPGWRWPAYWGPNFDWMPDQCAGGNLMSAAQLMLMQCEGGRIWLLPAWPRDWDCSFRLHAPRRTTVEGRVVDGQVVDLVVTPASRRKDVTVCPAQDDPDPVIEEPPPAARLGAAIELTLRGDVHGAPWPADRRIRQRLLAKAVRDDGTTEREADAMAYVTVNGCARLVSVDSGEVALDAAGGDLSPKRLREGVLTVVVEPTGEEGDVTVTVECPGIGSPHARAHCGAPRRVRHAEGSLPTDTGLR